MSFLSNILGSFEPDQDHKRFLVAWTLYHEVANKIDGHIKYPRTREEYELCHKAMIAGHTAMKNFLGTDLVRPQDKEMLKKWNMAKLEAVRRFNRLED